MVMPMIEVEMAVGMRMPRPVGMGVLVLVKNNFEPTAKRVRNPTQGFQARHVVTALEPRDHQLGHAKAMRQLPLSFTIARPQFQQLARTVGGDRHAVVGGWCRYKVHRHYFANLLREDHP